jgi:hypothetical protein
MFLIFNNVWNTEITTMLATSQIPGIGIGVIAHRDYMHHEVIGTYSGRVGDVTCMLDFEYAIILPEGNMFVGDHEDYRGIGQFINDSCRPCIENYPLYSLTSTKLKQVVEDYAEESQRRENIYFKISQGVILVHASRDVRAGEEFYRSYGSRYWMIWYFLTNQKNPFMTLYCGMLSESIRIRDCKVYCMGKYTQVSQVFEIIGMNTNDAIFSVYNIQHFPPIEKLFFLIELIQ